MALPDAVRQAGRRLRGGGRPIVEATVAASVAWFIAVDLLGHLQPFFAPAAALIVLGQSRGQRVGRTVEILLGVAGGVLAADLVVVLLGTRSTASVIVVVLLVTTATVALGASGLLAVQAAISGLYVAVIAPPTDSLVPVRFVDALVGGTVALLASQLSRHRDPLAGLVARSLAVMDDVADVLEAAAAALADGDVEGSRATLERARTLDPRVEELRAEVDSVREDLWIDLRRRERLAKVVTMDAATAQIDYLVRNARVLARVCVTVLVHAPRPQPDLTAAVLLLARAVRITGAATAVQLHAPREVDTAPQEAVEDVVLAAVRAGADLLETQLQLPAVLLVGQIRACAIDLLRVCGQERDASLRRVEEVLGIAPD